MNEKELIFKSEEILKIAKISSTSWGWPAIVWEEDFKQEAVLTLLENEEDEENLFKLASKTAKKVLKNHGWHRINRKWMPDSQAYQNVNINYLYNSERKKQARMKIPPEKRKEIARKGAIARKNKKRLQSDTSP